MHPGIWAYEFIWTSTLTRFSSSRLNTASFWSKIGRFFGRFCRVLASWSDLPNESVTAVHQSSYVHPQETNVTWLLFAQSIDIKDIPAAIQEWSLSYTARTRLSPVKYRRNCFLTGRNNRKGTWSYLFRRILAWVNLMGSRRFKRQSNLSSRRARFEAGLPQKVGHLGDNRWLPPKQ